MGRPLPLLVALAELAALFAWKEQGIAAAGNLLMFWLWARVVIEAATVAWAEFPGEPRRFLPMVGHYLRIGVLTAMVAYGYIVLPALLFSLMVLLAAKRHAAREKAAKTKPQEVTHD